MIISIGVGEEREIDGITRRSRMYQTKRKIPMTNKSFVDAKLCFFRSLLPKMRNK